MGSIFLLGGLFRSGKAWAVPCLSLTRNQCVSLKEGSIWPRAPSVIVSFRSNIIERGSGFWNISLFSGAESNPGV